MSATTSKFALVTASSAGVGAAIARMLVVECGMSVIVNYSSNAERAASLVRSLQASINEKQGQQSRSAQVVHAVRANLLEQSAVRELVSETLRLTGGRLDVLVSNYGWTRMTDFSDLNQGVVEEDWDYCFAANVKSHLWLFHAARSALEATEGVFVSTASVAGVTPSGSSLPYAVTKAALIHLIKSLAIITAPRIRVICMSPGILLTDWGMAFPQEKLAAAKDQNKLKRFATVEDVADQVRVLVQSRSITGQNIIIDAGFSL